MLLGFAVLLELLGRLVGSTAISIAAAAALGAVLGDAVLTPRIEHLTLTRDSPTRMVVGAESPVRLVLSQPSRRHSALPPLLLNDDHPSLTPVRVLTPSLPRGRTVVVTLRVTPPHRGHWEAAGDDTLEAFSPLGGFRRRRTFTFADARWVHPAPATPIRLPDIALGTGAGSSGVSRSGQGTEFYGIRDWRSGDAAANVHWRASARRNQLVVMERERPATAALVVVVAASVPGQEWEQSLARAASTAIAARRLGRSVTLICDTSLAMPDTPTDVLDWFATVGDPPGTDCAALPEVLRQLGPGATVLWLSMAAVPAQVAAIARSATATIVTVRTDQSPPVHR